MHLDVFLTQCALTDEDLEGRIAVVIDVLRATTTITSALSAGAHSVQPAADKQAVEHLAAQVEDGNYLRAGERDGVKIDGYDLGNSPLDYTAQTVAGKTVILTTTNGTRALSKAGAADQIVVASLLNSNRVARFLHESTQDVVLLCAGRYNRPALEDSLCAGLIIHHLDRLGLQRKQADAAHMVHAFYQRSRDDLAAAVEPGSSAQRLRSIGHERDLPFCLQQDTLPLLPTYADGKITLH